MNPLFQVTKSGICERLTLSNDAFPDPIIYKAIEEYEKEKLDIVKVRNFFKAIAPLWDSYSKGEYRKLFTKYIDFERSLEIYDPNYTSHLNHVVQEFLFGYNILISSEKLKKWYDYRDGRKNGNSNFGRLFFSWMAASLLHDIGYDIERAAEEEFFREEKNLFWDFMTPRKVTDRQIGFFGNTAPRIIRKYILPRVSDLVESSDLEYDSFISEFTSPIKNREGWRRFDHGLISAIKYIVELEKIQKTNGGEFLTWRPNVNAFVAMTLHNIRYKKIKARISSKNPDTFITYLLIACDETQEWERERKDTDSFVRGENKEGKQAVKSTDLEAIVFREKYAFLTVNHKLKDPSLRDDFENSLIKRILMQRKDYPIRVHAGMLKNNMRVLNAKRKIIGKKESRLDDEQIDITERIRMLSKYVDISEKVIRLYLISKSKKRRRLLLPERKHYYSIILEHRIENRPYMAVVFPF